MRHILMVLLICHFTGDYYLQTEELARAKDSSYRGLLRHLVLYCIPFIASTVIFPVGAMAVASLVSVVLHTAIDISKYCLLEKVVIRNDARTYLLDQGAHIITLLVAAVIGEGISPVGTYLALSGFFSGFGTTIYDLLRWVLALLLIYKPSNITFVKLFASYKPREVPTEEERMSSVDLVRRDRLKTGGIIGALEKTIILIFLVSGDPMAAGLVLTAKSIARYDRISRSPGFAEYYLIGTLTSLLMVMVIYNISFRIL